MNNLKCEDIQDLNDDCYSPSNSSTYIIQKNCENESLIQPKSSNSNKSKETDLSQNADDSEFSNSDEDEDFSLNLSSSVSYEAMEIRKDVSENTPQKELLVCLLNECEASFPEKKKITELINQFISHRFCNIKPSNWTIYSSVTSKLKVIKDFYSKQNLNSNPKASVPQNIPKTIHDFITAIDQFLYFDNLLKSRFLNKEKLFTQSPCYINISHNKSLLGNKRSLSKVNNLDLQHFVYNELNKDADEKIDVKSVSSTAQSSPCYDDLSENEDLNALKLKENRKNQSLNKLNFITDISNINYGCTGILKNTSESVDLLSEVNLKKQIKLRWKEEIKQERVFLFTDEPNTPEITPEEYEYIQFTLLSIKKRKLEEESKNKHLFNSNISNSTNVSLLP